MQLRSILDTAVAGSESAYVVCQSGHIGAIVLRNNSLNGAGTLVVKTAESTSGPAGEIVFDQAVAKDENVVGRVMVFDPPLSLRGFGFLEYTAVASAGSTEAQIYEWVA